MWREVLFIALWVAVAACALLFLFGMHVSGRECAAKGGVYVRVPFGHECLDVKVLR